MSLLTPVAERLIPARLKSGNEEMKSRTLCKAVEIVNLYISCTAEIHNLRNNL